MSMSVWICYCTCCIKQFQTNVSISFSALRFFRNRRSQMVSKIVVIETFANFTGKHLFWSLFLLKKKKKCRPKETPSQVFPVKFAKFLILFRMGVVQKVPSPHTHTNTHTTHTKFAPVTL